MLAGFHCSLPDPKYYGFPHLMTVVTDFPRLGHMSKAFQSGMSRDGIPKSEMCLHRKPGLHQLGLSGRKRLNRFVAWSPGDWKGTLKARAGQEEPFN